MMRALKMIFTWWDGATFGTALFTRFNGVRVGSDVYGNVYFQAKKGKRRWVIYNGPNDASRIPPEWYAWIHHQIDGLPDEALPPPPKFLKPPMPNMTGTPAAYRPSGSLDRGPLVGAGAQKTQRRQASHLSSIGITDRDPRPYGGSRLPRLRRDGAVRHPRMRSTRPPGSPVPGIGRAASTFRK